MSDIEEEIRRQMLAERQQQAGQQQGGQYTYNPVPPPEQKPSTLHRWKSQGGLLGGLASILLVLAKFFGPIFVVLSKLKFLAFAGKFLLTGGSMLASMWLEAMVFGWPLAVGIVLLIFIHECGHALAAKILGREVKGMIFIPFMGAAVATRGGRNVVENAFIGIMGPVFGTLGGLACMAIFMVHPMRFWLVLARWNFAINLFNLLPTAPLDGGWITPIFSAKLLAVGVVLLFAVAPANPFIWLLALMSIPRIISGWKARPDDPYYQATANDRIKYGLAYLGLAAFLGLITSWLRSYLSVHYPFVA
jgi:Zn-dependent protease